MRPIAVGSGGALLEREQELRVLHDAIEGLDAGDGTVVLLEGVAGAGKSRLLEAARESAAASGIRILVYRPYAGREVDGRQSGGHRQAHLRRARTHH